MITLRLYLRHMLSHPVATRPLKDEYSTGDQAIILGVQIFLDHRSLSSMGQKKFNRGRLDVF